ncbi:hypothetical protein [Mobilicoccus caccae]|uniref:C2H2-type domain-containing protein n=1 Tax=Mobilicoccus caccae TaxID=1859295 RepID=A0ABQ6IZ24_9MICO|nr:hypothetical protein [Mobilicoccus caccae]GMA42422.1 hypothetical protein GCM10025883_44670 [Mobilicoccus caccae]
MSEHYDEGSTGEDFGGPNPFGAMIECPECGSKYRTAERLSALHTREDCREAQFWAWAKETHR